MGSCGRDVCVKALERWSKSPKDFMLVPARMLFGGTCVTTEPPPSISRAIWERICTFFGVGSLQRACGILKCLQIEQNETAQPALRLLNEKIEKLNKRWLRLPFFSYIEPMKLREKKGPI